MLALNRLRTRTLGTVAALATAATCAVLLPTAAHATTAVVRPADGTGTTNTNTPLFATPSPSDGSEITLRPGYTLDLHCWVDGDWYDGTNRWFETNWYGMWYWVNANQISNQPTLPHC
ncbi:MAG TPA: hypothetical protein VFU65_20935 [Actinocrinis sp.]|nr:hypothetical protein [Actinocrinis sp.]